MLTILLGGGLFTGIFISILLFIKPGSIPKENKFLSLIVLICTINIIHPHWYLITGHRVIWNNFLLLEPAQFLIIPMIWIYIRNHLKGNFKMTITDYFHFIPFFVVISFLISPLATFVEEVTTYPVASILIWSLLILLSVFYIILLNSLLNKVKRQLKNEVSNFKVQDLKWNQLLYHLFFILSIGYYSVFFLLLRFQSEELIKTLLSISFLIAIWVIGIYGLKRKEVMPEVIKVSNKNSIKKELETEILEVLKTCMNKDKLYLNADLTLNDLTKISGYSRNELSWVLNKVVGKNFYKYINDFRIEQVISFMNNPKFDNENILTLAFDSGFNTKQSFNSVFKTFTCKTPSEYRKSL